MFSHILVPFLSYIYVGSVEKGIEVGRLGCEGGKLWSLFTLGVGGDRTMLRLDGE